MLLGLMRVQIFSTNDKFRKNCIPFGVDQRIMIIEKRVS